MPENPTNTEDFVSEDYLEKKLKYELITKRFQKTQEELKLLDRCNP